MAEGWTRHVLESYGFAYQTVMDAPFRQGRLAEEIDVLLLPDDRPEMIIGPAKAGAGAARFRAMPVPPEYRSGIGEEGVAALAKFVQEGGRVVGMAEASALVIQSLGLRMRNAVEGLDAKTYFCKGSTLWAEVASEHRLGYGMLTSALVLNVQSAAFDLLEGFRAEDYQVVVRYGRDATRLLQSGWLIGGERIAGKPAMVATNYGRGEAILIGFPCQFRGQTHGTFKLLFNCLY